MPLAAAAAADAASAAAADSATQHDHDTRTPDERREIDAEYGVSYTETAELSRAKNQTRANGGRRKAATVGTDGRRGGQ